MMCSSWTIVFATLSTALVLAPAAYAGGPIELGGKTAVSANFSVTTEKPDKFQGLEITNNIVYIGTSITRTTRNARWEYGAGVTIAIFDTDIKGSGGLGGDATFTAYTPTAQLRINSDLLGPEENFLVYAGAVAGVTIVDFEAFDDELGAFGPKFGAEYYFTSNVAVQLEDLFLVDTDKGINNNLSLGVKLLF